MCVSAEMKRVQLYIPSSPSFLTFDTSLLLSMCWNRVKSAVPEKEQEEIGLL